MAPVRVFRSGPVRWAASVPNHCGAATLSLRGGGRRLVFNARLTGLMLVCALLASLRTLIFKIFAPSREFWTASFWLISTTSLFVFLIGALLSLLAPSLGKEVLSRPNLSRKLLSTALITTGVILVSA
jgi:hypothetical protein